MTTTLKMPSINQVALSGSIHEDPEFRQTEDGSLRLSGRVISKYGHRDKEGTWHEEELSIPIILFDKSAAYFAERLFKDTKVFLTGRLRSNGKIFVQVRSLQILKEKENEVTEDNQRITTD